MKFSSSCFCGNGRSLKRQPFQFLIFSSLFKYLGYEQWGWGLYLSSSYGNTEILDAHKCAVYHCTNCTEAGGDEKGKIPEIKPITDIKLRPTVKAWHEGLSVKEEWQSFLEVVAKAETWTGHRFFAWSIIGFDYEAQDGVLCLRYVVDIIAVHGFSCRLPVAWAGSQFLDLSKLGATMSLKDLGEVCASLLGKSIQEPGYNSSCPVLHHHGGPHPRRWDLSEPGSRGCPCWKTAATEHEGHLCESGTLRCCGTVCRDLSVVWLILSQTWHKDLNGQECKQLRF